MKITWLSVVTLLVIVILLLNSFFIVFGVYKKLGIDIERKKKPENDLKIELKKELKTSEVLLILIMVIAFSAGLLVDKAAPDNILSRFISHHGLWVYLAWCFILPILFGVVLEIIKYPFKKKT